MPYRPSTTLATRFALVSALALGHLACFGGGQANPDEATGGQAQQPEQPAETQTSSGGPAAIAEDEVAAYVAEQQCDQQLDCSCYLETGPVGEDAAEHTRNACIENRRLEIEHWQKQRAGLTFDASCLASRLAAAKAWACDDEDDVAVLTAESDSCDTRCRIYHGHKTEGLECDNTFDDCAQGLKCSYWGSGSSYVCRPACEAAGAACDYDGQCGPGLFCRYDFEPYPSSGTESCQPLPKVGESCEDSYECVAGARCDFASDTCVDPIADGQACDPNIPCAGVCRGDVCEASTPSICGWDLRYASN
jgi:hypothetical protein